MFVRALSNQKANKGRKVARQAAVIPRPSSTIDTMAKFGAETRRSCSATPMTSTYAKRTIEHMLPRTPRPRMVQTVIFCCLCICADRTTKMGTRYFVNMIG